MTFYDIFGIIWWFDDVFDLDVSLNDDANIRLIYESHWSAIFLKAEQKLHEWMVATLSFHLRTRLQLSISKATGPNLDYVGGPRTEIGEVPLLRYVFSRNSACYFLEAYRIASLEQLKNKENGNCTRDIKWYKALGVGVMRAV